MQRISYRPCHLTIACELRYLPIGSHMSVRYLLYSFIYSFRRAVTDQIVALGDHQTDVFIRNASVKYYRIPVVLILMIARFYRCIEITPEKSLVGCDLNIEIYVTVLLIGPQKSFPVPFKSHKLPPVIMKRGILIGVGK